MSELDEQLYRSTQTKKMYTGSHVRPLQAPGLNPVFLHNQNVPAGCLRPNHEQFVRAASASASLLNPIRLISCSAAGQRGQLSSYVPCAHSYCS